MCCSLAVGVGVRAWLCLSWLLDAMQKEKQAMPGFARSPGDCPTTGLPCETKVPSLQRR